MKRGGADVSVYIHRLMVAFKQKETLAAVAFSLILIPLTFWYDPVLVGLCSLILVVGCSYRWGMWVGLSSALWAGFTLVLAYLLQGGDPVHLAAGLAVFFLLAGFIGRGTDIIRRQRDTLRERVKEFNTLYQLAEMLGDPDRSIEQMLREVAQLLRAGFSSPDDTDVRIRLDGQDYVGRRFQPSMRQLESVIMVEGESRGTLQVCLSDDADVSFLAEEERLVSTVTRMIGQTLERRFAERKLRASEEYVRSIINLIPDIIIRCSRSGIYLDIIKFSEGQLYRPKEELIGKNITEILPEKQNADLIGGIEETLNTGEIHTIEYRLSVPEGDLWFEARIVPATQDEVLMLIRNISRRKKLEQDLIYLSFHDEMTGLYNRAYAEQQMEAIGAEEKNLPLSIIMADLNGLKFVNDSLGHEAGDKLLQKTAELIRQSCREKDLVARWGGDEFLVILPNTPEDQAAIIRERIAETTHMHEIEETGLLLSVALGCATKTSNVQEMKEVMVEAESQMYRKKLSSDWSVRGRILSVLMQTLGEKSHETHEHVRRMEENALKIADAINLDSTEVQSLKMLITLHDIGKINIPGDILVKPGSLTEKEREIMRTHPEVGFRIASRTDEFAEVVEEILHHHEWWDGTGYPDGLQGEDIPLLSRITSIVDAYDAMTNDRSYGDALQPQEVIREFERCAGTQFDPELVDVFLGILRNECEPDEIRPGG